MSVTSGFKLSFILIFIKSTVSTHIRPLFFWKKSLTTIGAILVLGFSPRVVLPYKRLIGMCRWMGLHFHDWSDYNGVAFSIDLLEWGRKFSDFGVK